MPTIRRGASKPNLLLPGVIWCDGAQEAARGADVLVILTEWNEFRALDLDAVKAAMTGKTIIDLRNVLDFGAALELGLRYQGMGRGKLASSDASCRSA